MTQETICVYRLDKHWNGGSSGGRKTIDTYVSIERAKTEARALNFNERGEKAVGANWVEHEGVLWLVEPGAYIGLGTQYAISTVVVK